MKKIIMAAVALTLTLTMTTVLTSCSIEDNPAPVTDNKPFPYDSEIDYSVRPGDNFYRYALGQWLNSSNPSPSASKQINDEMKQLFNNMLNTSNDPVLVTLRSQADQTLNDDSKSRALLNERLQMLEQVTTAIKKFFLSYAQVWKGEEELDNSLLKYYYLYDDHSANHNRVNGMMRLQDDWYRLYDVKPTDKLYVAPENRVKIW